MLNESQLEQLRIHLGDERDMIVEQSSASDSSSATVELDQTRTGRLSRMDAMQAQAMAKAGGQRARERLLRIDAALKRMDSGEYGECRDCGEWIPFGRLNADPCALFCVDCAETRQD